MEQKEIVVQQAADDVNFVALGEQGVLWLIGIISRGYLILDFDLASRQAFSHIGIRPSISRELAARGHDVLHRYCGSTHTRNGD